MDIGKIVTKKIADLFCGDIGGHVIIENGAFHDIVIICSGQGRNYRYQTPNGNPKPNGVVTATQETVDKTPGDNYPPVYMAN